ncbi:MFS transporter [Clostridium estertheticum]|uniref:MFS transporter n=1 Tax=Clostridium estertheticum TaxID=238834 RepID=UPI001C0B26C8|nr:MFS transporter [Clostridium estertheticum]MBU3172714.1 MFS transporter [Clostridium estertheticum]
MVKIKENLWTKNFLILSLINFFLTLIYFLLNSTITIYAINNFKASTGQAGFVAGIFIIGTLIGRIFTGRMHHSKKLLTIGLSIFILSSLLYFADYGLMFLTIVRLINGFSIGVVTTIVATVVAITLPLSRKGEGISYFAVSTAIGTGIGPFIGLYLSQSSNFNTIFMLCFMLGIVSLGSGIFVDFSMVPVRNSKNEYTELKLSNFIEPKVISISIIILAASFCFSSVLSYITLYAIELSLVKTASYFFMVYTVVVLISRPFTGRIVDKKGANFIIYPALVIFAIGLILLSSVTNSITLLLAGALMGLGFGNVSSISQTIAIKSAEPNRLGLATATFSIFSDIGSGFGPSIIGLIIPLIGYKTLYMSLGITVFVIPVFYYFLLGRKGSTYELPTVK